MQKEEECGKLEMEKYTFSSSKTTHVSTSLNAVGSSANSDELVRLRKQLRDKDVELNKFKMESSKVEALTQKITVMQTQSDRLR